MSPDTDLGGRACWLAAMCACWLGSGLGAAQAALSISASASVDTARPGELVQVELLVANSDAFARSGVTITMTFPAGINQIFESEFDADCPSTSCSAGETAVWTLGTIPAGGSVMVDIPATIASTVADGTVVPFDATVTDDAAASDSDSASVAVDLDVTYDLAVAENADPATPASTLRYKLSYARRADAGSVQNSQLAFTLPAGTTFVSASDGGTLNGSDVEWPLGFMAPGDGGIRDVTVALSGTLDAGTAIKANAEIGSLTTLTQRIGATASTAIAASRTFGLAVESVIGTLRISELANVQIMVTNNDPFTRFGVVLRGRYPQGFNQVFESIFDGDCASTSCSTGELIRWNLGDIPAGGSRVVDLPPQLATTEISGTIRDLHFWVSDDQNTSARRSDSLRVQTDSIYDLAITESADPAIPGSQLRYKLTFGHRADAAAVTESRLVFPLPAGTTFVSATGGATVAGGRVEWPLGFLSPGDSGIREVVVDLAPGLPNGAIVEAAAEIRAASTLAERARAEANTAIATSPPLAIAIETNPIPTRTPELSNYQLTVTNRAAFTRFGVVLQGRFPQNVNQTFESEFDGNCASTTCSSGERIEWTLGDIPAGAAVTVDLPASVASSVTGGTLINLFSWVRDDQGSEARRADTMPVSTITAYDLSLTENSDPAAPGDGLTYKLTWAYDTSAAAVSNSILRFPVPNGATFVSAGDGGLVVDNVVEWPLGFVSPGDGGVRTVSVTLDPGLADGDVIEAHADIASVSDQDHFLRSEANTVIATDSPLAIYIESNPNPARTNELLNQQLTVANNDAFTRFGVVLTARYPASTVQLFESEFDGNCASTSCSAGERVTWMLGDIPAGTARTVDLPYVVFSGVADGTLINLYASATDGLGAQALQADSIRVQADTVYDIGLAERVDPVLGGDLIRYELTYGYREDAAAVADSTLRFSIPDGTSFVSASGSATVSGNDVVWSLGPMFPGDGDVRFVTVQADAGLTSGAVIEASAQLFATGGPENARAEADTSVAADVPLTLEIVPNRNNVEGSQPLDLTMTVTNNDPFTRFGVELFARYPQSANPLSEALFDGDCASTSCTSGERVRWLLGDIPAGQSATALLPVNVSGTVVDGVVMEVYAWANDDQGDQTRDVESALFGCVDSVDADCDAISDTVDNCTTRPNFAQQDTDSDDIGNACDPDIAPVSNDCAVNFLDLNAMKAAFFSGPADASWNPDADLNSDNAVNFVDLNTMKAFFFGPPGPSAAGCN